MSLGYDMIGDIHGHADRLEALLQKMGYHYLGGAWRHPVRTAIFVGDLIDRGPHQVRTLKIVRAMIDAGSARATMGNHEFNAIAWATLDPMNEGDHLRTRQGAEGKKNRHQHEAFLSDVGEDTPHHREWIAWMSGLPLWIEEPEFRVVHACWSPDHAEATRPHLREKTLLTPELVNYASRKGHGMYTAVEILLKGEEVSLPEGSVKNLGCSCGFSPWGDLAVEAIVEHCGPNGCDAVRTARRPSHPLLLAHARIGDLVDTAFRS